MAPSSAALATDICTLSYRELVQYGNPCEYIYFTARLLGIMTIKSMLSLGVPYCPCHSKIKVNEPSSPYSNIPLKPEIYSLHCLLLIMMSARGDCERPCFDHAHILECQQNSKHSKMCAFSGSKHGSSQSPPLG